MAAEWQGPKTLALQQQFPSKMMVKSEGKSQFEASLSAFRWRSWLLAIVLAGFLNCCLFLFLPLFMTATSEKKEIDQIVNNIQVIRLKEKEIPPQKRKQKPPEPPKQKNKPKEKLKAPKPKINKALTLPFKLNTRLPTVSTDFQLKYADNIRFSPLGATSVDMDKLDEPLTAIARIPPVYPILARRRGTEGWVRVAFEVDENGYVDNLHILESKPLGIFDKSVMQCVSKWRYKPGTVEGVAVRAKTETTIRFELE